MTVGTKSTNPRPTTHRTHTSIFTTLGAADYSLYIHFATKVAHPERPSSRSNDSLHLYYTATEHTRGQTHLHIYLLHMTRRGCPCTAPAACHPPTYTHPNPPPSRFHLQSARFSLQSTIPPLFGWHNCSFWRSPCSPCFCSQVQRGGGEAKYSFPAGFVFRFFLCSAHLYTYASHRSLAWSLYLVFWSYSRNVKFKHLRLSSTGLALGPGYYHTTCGYS